MENILEIFELLQEFREDIIIGNVLHPEKEKMFYNDLSLKEIETKHFKNIMCGSIAELFLSKIRAAGYNGTRIFIYNDFIINLYDLVFDEQYINAVVKMDDETIKRYENKVIFDRKKRGTHGIIEINVDSDIYTIDPKAGLIYPAQIKNLIKGENIHESWKFINQHEYIKSSYHMQRPCTLVFTTLVYWSHVCEWYYRNTAFDPIYKNYFQKKGKQ